MATGVGFSFDTSFLKNLEKADAKMASLMDKSNQASRSIVSAFQQMNNQGVVPFVQNLEKQKQTLDSVFDAITTKTGKARKGYEGMASSVIDATNALVSLISKMKSTSQYQHDTKLTGLSAQIKELQEYQERQRQVKVASAQAMNAELDKYRQLIERVRELNSIKAQAKEVKTTSTDSELVRDANKAQREANAELRTLKEQQKQIEQKYAVETALIRKQADAQSFKDKASQAAAATKAVEAEIKKEQDAYLKSLSEKIRAQQEYAQRMKELEQARLRQQSANRRASYKLDVVGGTGLNAADQALRYADRIYSDRGLRSVNNMQKAIQQMQQAQNRLNLNTEAGKRKYEELGQKIKQVEKDLERLNTRAKSFGDIMKKVGYSVGVYFSISAMKNFGKKLVDVTKEFERQKVALQNLLQNKDEANRLWEKTVALAIKSPYTTQQLVTYTKQLAAYRIEHDKLYETTKMLADVSSGLGVEMNRMILAFGQVKAATYLRATELRQFTEAGVNMLDELARLYTELEGVEVKAGDVFERITRRQVVFSDVEEVFERLTSKGGMFFRMQETQAQTLYGQWANLQDIYQVSLDEMGRSVRGGMVFVISTLRTLVENWRLVATAIESVGTAWVAIKIGNWIATLNKADRTARMLTVTFGNLRKIMLSWQGAVGVLGVLASVLYNYFSNLSQVNQRYVDLRRGTIDNSIAFEQLAEKVEKNNEAIEKYDKLLKDSTKTEEEINNIQKERNKVIGENNKLLAETKSKYEDLLPYVQENANGTLNFDKAIQVMQNRERAYLILQQKAKATLLRNALDTNIGNWRKEYNEAEEALIEYQTKLNDVLAKGDRYELVGDQLIDLQELYTYIKDVKSIEEFQRALSEMPEGMKTFAMYNKYAKDLRGELGDVVGDFSKVSSFFVDNAHIVTEALDGIDKDLTLGVGEAAEVEQKKAGEAFDKLLERLGVVDEEVIKKIHEYVNNISREKFNIVLDFNYKTDEERGLLNWQERYNEFIEKLSKGKNIAELRKITSFEIETDGKIKELDELIKEQENIINRGKTKGQQRYTPKEIADARTLLSVYKEARAWFGKNNKETKKEESEELKRLKEQIRLVRQLADDYEEMWKKYGKAYADANIKSEARRNAFTELELNIDDFEVGTRQEEKNNLGKLLEKALGIEGGKVEVEKAVADVEVELNWEIQQQKNDAFKRELESMFGSYEISMELEKLNIPKDAIKNLFGIEPIELPEVRVKGLEKAGLGSMTNLSNEAILASQAYKDLNEKQQKDLADHLKKVDDMERKAQEERLKKYVAFARGAISERAKIKLEELNKLAEIEKTFEHKGTDTEAQRAEKDKYKKLATEQARKEANDALQKLDWEAFRSSDTFNVIFDDLENAGEKSLQVVIDKLKAFKEQWKDMPFDQMRQVVDLLQKAEEAQNSSDNPFVEAKRLRKSIKKDGRSYEKATQDLIGYDNMIRITKEDISNYQLFEQIQSGLADPTKLTTEQQAEYARWIKLSNDEQKLLLRSKERELGISQQNAANTQKHINNIKKLPNEYQKQADAIGKMQDMANNLYNSFKGLHEALGGDTDSIDYIFADMGMQVANTVLQTMALQVQLASATVQAGTFAAAMNAALGPIGWVVAGMSVLTSVFSAFSQAHDKKKERQIQAEIKLVERLQKVYDDLGETIENTYSMDTLNQATKMSKKNLDEQIAATERMIQAEYDKKDTDHERIEDWKDEIEDAKKALKELNEQAIEEKGGFGGEANRKSAATAFVDAWLQAYKETGDGLSGLNEQFDEFYEDFAKKQLLLGGVDKYLENFFNKFDTDISKIATPADAEKVAKEIITTWDGTAQNLDSLLRTLAENLGLSETLGAGTLGGLQKNIQGVSEETADVLASYMNSIRLFVADSNTQLKALVAAQSLDGDAPNPMLSQLLSIAEQTRAIRDLFDSVVGYGNGGNHNGAYLKVAIG